MKNDFIRRMQAAESERTKELIELTEGLYRQLMTDCFVVSMRKNGISVDRAVEICKGADAELTEFCTNWKGEICSKNDPDKKSHARETLQRKLEKLCAGRVISWEERYEGLEKAWELCYERRVK